MSALDQKRTFCDAEAMSALPPKADIDPAPLQCLLCANSGHRPLLDHLVGNSDPTHDRVIHSVDCFPRLRVMPVFVILKLMSPFAKRDPDKDIRFGSVTAFPSSCK
jgi:hypothetical protein